MKTQAPIGDIAAWGEPIAAGKIKDAEIFDYPVYRRDPDGGPGPAVILLHEAFGITPIVIGLGDHLVAQGFTVVMPYLFGEPDHHARQAFMPSVQARICIMSEFRALGLRSERGFSVKLRALAAALKANDSPGGVGVIGMCFTGGFALAAAMDDAVVAPVLSQPSLPYALPGPWSRALPVGREEMTEISRRARDDGLCVLGLRFSDDRIAPKQRFAALKRRLGDAFEIIELDSSWGNPGGNGPMAHSVLTGEVREEPPNEAHGAREKVVRFLNDRLT
ncbi:dienelactone hydrolase family protein [Agromyces sp. SYSU K20354]|uniref:dienelactone hydrolase family protein n=1 Tax=Agromyces cavernae TaxID=2898659 RepID=UPI001E36BDE3|nr:dienelactone hydrolase family protein [Agromyces cavernae]MCD2443270.1 dienelactone hydrolase family protein [Agromyces cavernae]